MVIEPRTARVGNGTVRRIVGALWRLDTSIRKLVTRSPSVAERGLTGLVLSGARVGPYSSGSSVLGVGLWRSDYVRSAID